MQKNELPLTESGQSLLDTMMITMLLGLIVVGYGSVSNTFKKSLTNKTLQLTAELARIKVMSYFDDPVAWKATFSSVLPVITSFSATPTAQPPQPGLGQKCTNLILYVPSSVTKKWDQWNTTDPTFGLTETGIPCNSYPDAVCKYRYEFYYRNFPAQTFGKELVEITGIFLSKVGDVSKYNFRIYKTKPP